MSKKILEDKAAPAIVLLIVCLKRYGSDIFIWGPELLKKQVLEDFSAELSDLQSDKLQTAITVLATDYFESHWQVFATCCHLFNGTQCGIDEVNPLEAEELIVGMAEAMLIRHEPLDYHDDVNVYAGEIFHNYGFFAPPELFPTAIMPSSGDSAPRNDGKKSAEEKNDEEKNEALLEMFNHHIEYVFNYVKAND